MPSSLSPLFSKIFTDEKHQTLLKGLIQPPFNWDCVEVFKKADDYSSAIEAFLKFYNDHLIGLQNEGLFYKAGDLFEALQAAEEAYRESERLCLKEIADTRAASWCSANDDVQEDEVVISQVYQASSESDHNNAVVQKEIDLFANLVRLAGSPVSSNASLNTDIQNAIAHQDTFALLKAWLEEVNAYEGHNSELKQSLLKALVTAYLLLHKPVIQDNSEYTDLLGFLLDQASINENLVLDVIKLQVKIYLLANDDLAETNELLGSLLTFKDHQGEANVPKLSQAFFERFAQLSKDINLYQEEDRQFLLNEFNGLNVASDNDQTEQYFAFVTSYTKDLLSLSRPVDSHVAQTMVSQADNFPEEQMVFSQDPGKQEFSIELLKNAKQITANTSGQSRKDLDNLFSILTDKYYALEEVKSLRKIFRAELVKNAAEGFVFPLKGKGIALSQYLASVQLNSEDKPLYISLHCEFFHAVIKQHASNTLTLEDYKKIIKPLLGLLNKDTEAFVTRCVLLFADLDVNKTLQVIRAEKPEKGKAELMSKLAATITTQHLPSFQLLMRLHPEAKQLFTTPKFVSAMQMAANLAMMDENDIHSPLLQLLKVCLFEKESALAHKVLLLFMALKKPDQALHTEAVRLLSQDKRHQGILQNLTGIELNSFADYRALLREAAKTKDVDHDLIGKLFTIAMTKAKDVKELLSLASACKDNAVLAEHLAKTLFSRFPKLAYLKVLMKRVNCSEAVEKVIDEEIAKQISNFEKTLGFTETEKCEKLFEFIEKQIAPQINQSLELNALLDKHRKIISDRWLKQLAVYRDQLMFSDELLTQCQVLDGEKVDGQPFVSLFDEVIASIQKITTPSLADLQKANALIMNLLIGMKEEKDQIGDRYVKLTKTYQSDLETLVQNQDLFVQEIDQKLTQLNESRQQVTEKKSAIFAVLEDIKKNLGKNGFSNVETMCQDYLDAVAKQFVAMEEATNAQLQQLVDAKAHQVIDLRELTALLGDDKQSLPQKMQTLRVKQQRFTRAKQTTNQLAAQIQTQVDTAQKSLFEQMKLFKGSFSQVVTQLNQQCEEADQQQAELKAQISNVKRRQEQIPLELKKRDEEKFAVGENIRLVQEELKRKEEGLAKLSQTTLEPVSKEIRKLSATPQFKASITKFIELFKQAIESRYIARYSGWIMFKHAFAEWATLSPWLPDSWIEAGREYINSRALENSSPFRVKVAEFVAAHEAYMPNWLVVWGQAVMSDHNHTLLNEITTLKTQLDQLERIVEKIPSQSSALDEQNKTFASEIRTPVSELLSKDLQIKNDQRASFLWRWLTNRALDKFLQENQQLEVNCKTLSETQARIDGLMTTTEQTRTQIRTLQQQPQQLAEEIAGLKTEDSQISEKLMGLGKTQKTCVETLNALRSQHEQLAPLYQQIISLASSPVIDILYDEGLHNDNKLNQLKDHIKNKSSLLQDGIGGGVCANIVYHVVRRGTVEMLTCILAALPEEDRRCYLATAIVDEGMATTPLTLAVKRNDQTKILCLIQQGKANPNQRILDNNGNETTLLLWAYQQGQSIAVDCLLANGADCQAKDSDGNALLQHAAAKGDAAMILRLLKVVSVIDAKNHNGDDVLALLMKSNLSAEKKAELMPKLFERLSEPTRLSGQYFMQPDLADKNFLHHAAPKGDLSLVKWLLAEPNKDLLNAKDKEGQTPLSLAVQAGQLAVVAFLFRQPIGLEGVKDVFLAALKQAGTSADMIKVFLTHNKVSLSDISALSDNPEFVFRKWTQDDQLQIKASSYSYLTTCANLENMKLLVDGGADPRATNDLGDTVLHDAVLHGDFQKVQYLIEECGVEPHPQNKAGRTPLMALYQTGKLPEGTHRQIVNYLIQRASGIVRLLPGQAAQTLTQTDEKGNRLLHYVAKVGDIEAINQLITQKPYFGENPLNHQNEDGETAVHVLARNNDLPEAEVNTILGFLYSKGQVNLHLADKSGKTPLDYATYFSVITFLIAKLPEPIQDVKLMPMALRVMASEGMTTDQKKQFVEGIARANKMNFAEASYFYQNVSYSYYNSKQGSSTAGLAPVGVGTNALSKNEYINSFNGKSEDEKGAEFRLMIIGQKPYEVAAILDSQSPPPFPEELNQESQAYLSLTANTELSSQRRNFWVRVVEYREKKELTLQDYATGNTLLHALVWANDKENIFTLNQKGVLYVTERDRKNRTVLMLAREQFPQEVKGQPSYTSFPTKDQSVYLSILQSIERRLVGFNDEVVKQIVSELDFSQVTELEMVVSLFDRLGTLNGSVEKTAFLWKLTDRNGKSLTESALAVFNGLAKGLSVEDKKLPAKELAEKNPVFVRCQSLLLHLLTASQVEQQGQPALGNKLGLCRQAMEDQIKYFAEKSKYNYILSEAAIQLKVLNFGRTLSSETSANVVSEQYKALCKESVQLRKATHSGQANRSAGLLSIFSAEPAKEAPLSPRQLQENHAHNMVVYLGLFMEASGIDTLVTLPSGSSASSASLLAVAREKQLPSLYVEIVGRVLAQLGLTNPIAMVEQTQAEAAYKAVVSFQNNFNRLHGVQPVAPAIPVGAQVGLRITAGSL